MTQPNSSHSEPAESASSNESKFSQEARTTVHPPLWKEFLQYVRETSKWWLLPILVCCLVLSLIAWAAGTSAAPFIYTLF
ncbi:MAG: DUF5989 family protein [Planctomycetaceae bacterium]